MYIGSYIQYQHAHYMPSGCTVHCVPLVCIAWICSVYYVPQVCNMSCSVYCVLLVCIPGISYLPVWLLINLLDTKNQELRFK